MSPLTSDFFLSTADVERLTGKKRYSAQARWLLDHGYKVEVNGLGMPIVAVEEVNRKLVGGPVRKKWPEPNWELMNPNYRKDGKAKPP
jgi:hypothetical protein